MLNTILLQAATGGDAANGGAAGWMNMLMIVALIAIFYFFMIAPQRKREKKINEFRSNIKKGDKVVTIGGIHGTIREIKEDSFILVITNGVSITVDKNAIAMS
jgi:preprotein translocase subunit YajC